MNYRFVRAGGSGRIQPPASAALENERGPDERAPGIRGPSQNQRAVANQSPENSLIVREAMKRASNRETFQRGAFHCN